MIVRDGKVIARGYNRRNTDKNTLCHAEITAIKKASKAIGDWRLEGCTMYVTLEPCQMCAGAILQARRGNDAEALRLFREACVLEPSFVHRGNLDPEVSSLLDKYHL